MPKASDSEDGRGGSLPTSKPTVASEESFEEPDAIGDYCSACGMRLRAGKCPNQGCRKYKP